MRTAILFFVSVVFFSSGAFIFHKFVRSRIIKEYNESDRTEISVNLVTRATVGSGTVGSSTRPSSTKATSGSTERLYLVLNSRTTYKAMLLDTDGINYYHFETICRVII